MSGAMPTDLDALAAIQGVGRARLEKYGGMFVAAIREHLGHAGG